MCHSLAGLGALAFAAHPALAPHGSLRLLSCTLVDPVWPSNLDRREFDLRIAVEQDRAAHTPGQPSQGQRNGVDRDHAAHLVAVHHLWRKHWLAHLPGHSPTPARRLSGLLVRLARRSPAVLPSVLRDRGALVTAHMVRVTGKAKKRVLKLFYKPRGDRTPFSELRGGMEQAFARDQAVLQALVSASTHRVVFHENASHDLHKGPGDAVEAVAASIEDAIARCTEGSNRRDQQKTTTIGWLQAGVGAWHAVLSNTGVTLLPEGSLLRGLVVGAALACSYCLWLSPRPGVLLPSRKS